MLVEHPRQVFSRDQLFELVWGSFGDRSAVAVYVGRLRQKIEPDPATAALHRHRLGRRLSARSGQQMRRAADPDPDVSPLHRPRPAAAPTLTRRRSLADRARPSASGQFSGRLNTAVGLPRPPTAADMRKPASVRGFASLLNRLDLLRAESSSPSRRSGKSRALRQPEPSLRNKRPAESPPGPTKPLATNWSDARRLIPTAKPEAGTLRHRPLLPTRIPVPRRRSSRSSPASSSCSPGSPSRSGLPAAGWSRR